MASLIASRLVVGIIIFPFVLIVPEKLSKWAMVQSLKASFPTLSIALLTCSLQKTYGACLDQLMKILRRQRWKMKNPIDVILLQVLSVNLWENLPIVKLPKSFLANVLFILKDKQKVSNHRFFKCKGSTVFITPFNTLSPF